MIAVLADITVVIVLQYINISNSYAVYLKHTQSYIIFQKINEKPYNNSLPPTGSRPVPSAQPGIQRAPSPQVGLTMYL